MALQTKKSNSYVAIIIIKKYNWNGLRFNQDPNISDLYGFVGDVHHIVYNTQKNIALFA